MALVATGLTKPRSIAFDTAGNLVVVESGAGISNLALQDDGDTCVSVRERTVVVQNSEVRAFSLYNDGISNSFSSTMDLPYRKMEEPSTHPIPMQFMLGHMILSNPPSAETVAR